MAPKASQSAILGSSSLGMWNSTAPVLPGYRIPHQAEHTIRQCSNYLCCGLCWAARRLFLKLLHRSLLRRHLHWSPYHRFLCSSLLRSTILNHGCLLGSLRRMVRRPALLCGFSNRPSACGTEFPLALRGFGRGGWLRRRLGWLLGFSPPFPLCVTNALPCGGTYLSRFSFWKFRRRGWFRPASVQHGPEFGNLRVDMPLLFLEAENGGVDDFRRELLCRHPNQSNSLNGSRNDHCTSTNLPSFFDTQLIQVRDFFETIRI